MDIRLYCYRDKNVGFGAPFAQSNDYTAKRAFAIAVNDSRPTDVAFAPADFDLYYIGTFDTTKARFAAVNDGVPEFIVNGAALVQAPPSSPANA